MIFQMRRIDHDAPWRWPLPDKLREDMAEQPIRRQRVKRLWSLFVRAVARWRIFPLQSVADHEDHAAYHPPVIDPWSAMGLRKKARYRPNEARSANYGRESHLKPNSERNEAPYFPAFVCCCVFSFSPLSLPCPLARSLAC